MKILFRALLLFIAFMVALSVIKFLFIKIFFFALWLAFVGFVGYVAYLLLKKA